MKLSGSEGGGDSMTEPPPHTHLLGMLRQPSVNILMDYLMPLLCGHIEKVTQANHLQ